MPVIRPMTEDDVAAVHDLIGGDLRGPRPPPRRAARAARRTRAGAPALPPPRAHAIPGGAWVAEDERGTRRLRAGAAARGRLGPLAAGRAARTCSRPASVAELLRRAHDYAARRPRPHHPVLGRPARDARLLAARPGRCTRACAADGHAARRLGDPAHDPRRDAGGHPVHRGRRPARPRRRARRRHRRAAGDGADAADRARARIRRRQRADGELRAARRASTTTARATLLRAVLARAGDREAVGRWLTAEQQWAIEVCLDAGLELRANDGAVFVDGDVGPFTPYIPSGAFL